MGEFDYGRIAYKISEFSSHGCGMNSSRGITGTSSIPAASEHALTNSGDEKAAHANGATFQSKKKAQHNGHRKLEDVRTYGWVEFASLAGSKLA